MSDTEETLVLDTDSFTIETIPAIKDDIPSEEESPQPERKGLFSRFRKSAGNEKVKERKVYPPMPRGGIAAPMAALYKKTGEFIRPFDPGCGTALIMGASDCGKAWEEVCKRNPAVRKWILMLLSSGANMELLVAHLPILAAVAIHHVPAVRDLVTKLTGDMEKMFAQSMAMASDIE